jgi:hypothetical protein
MWCLLPVSLLIFSLGPALCCCVLCHCLCGTCRGPPAETGTCSGWATSSTCVPWALSLTPPRLMQAHQQQDAAAGCVAAVDLRCAVLCCAVLCCAVLCCAVLCCAVLCCAVLCCAVLGPGWPVIHAGYAPRSVCCASCLQCQLQLCCSLHGGMPVPTDIT